jgi:flagellin
MHEGYNGKSLIGNIGGATIKNVNTIRNEAGATYSLVTYSGSALYNALTFTSVLALTNAAQAASVAALLTTATTGGRFILQQNSVVGELNTIGSNVNYVNNQITYNSNRIDALNTGLGSLVDADLAKESANLQALQIRQQLGTQALSLANQAPQTLLSLFK